MTTICPQCKKEINESTNRIIQDNCGHKKCRICLLQDETACKICNEESGTAAKIIKKGEINNSSISIIKYDQTPISSSEIKQVNNNPLNNQESKINEIEDVDKEYHKKIPHVSVISRSPITYKCTICLKIFSTNASAKYHFYCDGTEKPLKCDFCNKGFISKSHLDTHRLKHSGVRPFSCSKCQKSFTQKSKLNRHLKLHTGDRPFVCTECGKSFTNNHALTGHLRLHSGEQPYSCQQCGTRFNNKSNLAKHLATHSKEKLFLCDDCGKKFNNKWALISHKKNHKNEKPHSCEKCSKSFAKLKDLKRHNLTHLDIKPFCCNLCHVKFCRKDNLERHLKNTHLIRDIKDIKSAICKTGTNNLVIAKSSNCNNKTAELDNIRTKPLEANKSDLLEDNPNAIHVIKMSNAPIATSSNSIDIPIIRNAVPVINGPFKLAFKTDAFKNNYNILKRENVEEPPPRIQSMKPYDLRESLNICHKILSPMNSKPLNIDNGLERNFTTASISPIKNVIMSVGKVNEKDSLEICKKILTPDTPLHYETSFEHEKHAVIKNIKFKLPSTYTNSAIKSKFDIHEIDNKNNEFYIDKPIVETNIKQYTDLLPVKFNCHEIEESKTYKQSVIVNNISSDQFQKEFPFNEMHWRRRTAQNLQPKNQ